MAEAFHEKDSSKFIESEIATINKAVIQYLDSIIDEANIGNKIRSINILRTKTYEKLNQIQHEYCLAKAITELKNKNIIKASDQITWNPRQTGDANEPDIRVKRNGKVIISCELTTSSEAKGKIDQRMKEVLAKLNEMEGKKIFIVVSEKMRMRAMTKIANLGLNIEVMVVEL